MTSAQAGLVEAVNFRDAALQVNPVAITTQIVILLVGSTMQGHPGSRMFSDAIDCRGLVIGLAATK
jgi:hypothetical protein